MIIIGMTTTERIREIEFVVVCLKVKRAMAVRALAEHWGHSVPEVVDFVLALGLEHLERVPVLKKVMRH